MTDRTAGTVVIVSGGLMLSYTLLAAFRGPSTFKQGGVYKQVWAIGALTLGMSIVADVAPELAGPFALLVLVAAAARNRGAIGRVIAAPPGARGPVGQRPTSTPPGARAPATA